MSGLRVAVAAAAGATNRLPIGVPAARVIITLLLAGSSARAGPSTITPEEAIDRVGEIVTVEGTVTTVTSDGAAWILEFASGAAPFRAILLVPLLGAVPADPVGLWAGRRVRVHGRIARFKGHPEMILRDPDRVTLVGPMAPPPTPPRPPAPSADLPLRHGAAPCEQARDGWRAAAARVRADWTAFARCLDALRYACSAERAALAVGLGAVEKHEAAVADACR